MTKLSHVLTTLTLLSMVLWSRVSAAPVAALHVGGAVVAPADWTQASLAAHFASDVKTITYTLHGTAHTSRCVPLLDIVQAAQPHLNPRIKNHSLLFMLTASGHDGYTVAFSLPELLPSFGRRAVWLALDEDGKPLGDNGPFELIVPDDVKPGRWVHALTTVTVIDGAQTSSPSGT